ncbi:MAG TPA: STAS domain-containing protein [Nitrospiraceae bacterium]|nr:STAS domain-containing protein [Nitrospiraceae bacterium]
MLGARWLVPRRTSLLSDPPSPLILFIRQSLPRFPLIGAASGITIAEESGIHERPEGMAMLKITKVRESRSRVLLKLEGKITAQWASLLDNECRTCLRNRQSVRLDCTGVDFLDAKGIEVLRTLHGRNVTLISAPAFVTELLRTGGRS